MKKTKKEVRFINYRKYIIALGILAVFLLVINIMFRTSTVFATTYSTTMYYYCVRVVGGIMSIIPISVIEILCCIAVLVVLYALVSLIVTLIKYHSKATICFFTYKVKRYLLNLACIVLACLIIYTLNDSLLYKRLSFSVCANITAKTHSTDELKALYLLLENNVNTLADKVSRDENGQFTYGDKDVEGISVNAMNNIHEEFPFMSVYYPRPKPVLASRIMSYTGTAGFYSPFTLEANYNRDMPAIDLAHTLCHELAHISGFIHEDEANFIGYVACVKSGNDDFAYSGTVTALIYVLNELYEVMGADEYFAFTANLCEEVRRDLNLQAAYWSEFDTPVSEVSQNLNDAYIKFNGDTEGVRRYDMMVEMLIDYYRLDIISTALSSTDISTR